MYQIENQRQAVQGTRSLGSESAGKRPVSRNVVLLGFNSLLTDISSEMVSTILPLYLLFTLRLAPLQFGIIDGIYQGGSVLVRVASGFVVGPLGEPEGRGCRRLWAVCGLQDRLPAGQGSVGRPDRADHARPDRQGHPDGTARRHHLDEHAQPTVSAAAFGVHRALDTAGAMLGPLVAFGHPGPRAGRLRRHLRGQLLLRHCGACPAVLFVRNPARTPAADAPPKAGSPPSDAADLFRAPPHSACLLVAGSALSLATVSDSFLYLALQDQLDFNIGFFPLLFVATALVYMLLAAPVGIWPTASDVVVSSLVATSFSRWPT